MDNPDVSGNWKWATTLIIGLVVGAMGDALISSSRYLTKEDYLRDHASMSDKLDKITEKLDALVLADINNLKLENARLQAMVEEKRRTADDGAGK